MMPCGYLGEALYGAYVGMVTAKGSPLSDHDRQGFFESMAAFLDAFFGAKMAELHIWVKESQVVTSRKHWFMTKARRV